jgi:hypothetical protein
MVRAEPRYDILQCGVSFKFKAVPESPFSIAIFAFRGGDWFRKAKEWESEVDKSILVIL